MLTFEEIISAFGGPVKYAEAVGIPEFHGRTMMQRRSIPSAYWADTVSSAQSLGIDGVTLDVLAEIAKSKRAQSETAQ